QVSCRNRHVLVVDADLDRGDGAAVEMSDDRFEADDLLEDGQSLRSLRIEILLFQLIVVEQMPAGHGGEFPGRDHSGSAGGHALDEDVRGAVPGVEQVWDDIAAMLSSV